MNFLVLLLLATFRNLNNFVMRENPIISSTQLQERYDNFALYVTLRNERQMTIVRNLANNHKTIDLWQVSGKNLHILVNPNNLLNFNNVTRSNRLNTRILIHNVQRLIDQERNAMRISGFGWTRYHTLDEINNWMNSIINAYPNVTQAFNIGTSIEGRKIHGIKISYKSGNPGIFIESNIHAREWITSATATWIINELLTSRNIRARYLAENYDWYIIPVLNVDGFVYSHERDRLWRKNRRQNPNSTFCSGVDGNRNYNIHWMKNNGASSDPCDETYAGPFPFSEHETRGLANYVQSIKNRINILLAFHSYGQNVLSPFGYTNSQRPENYDDLMQVADAFSNAVFSLPYRTRYHAGTTSELLYIASGCTADWAYAQGIRITYTIEFRDRGQYGFLLPASYIIPNSREVLTGIFGMVTEADMLGYMDLKYTPNTKDGLIFINDSF